MSGYDDNVSNLVKLIKTVLQVEEVTPHYGKPVWGISFETTQTGIRFVPSILEHIIDDEKEQYHIYKNEVIITITPIDAENDRQRVKIIFKEFPLK